MKEYALLDTGDGRTLEQVVPLRNCLIEHNRVGPI